MSIVTSAQNIGYDIEIPEYKLFSQEEIYREKSAISTATDDTLQTLWKASIYERNGLQSPHNMNKENLHKSLQLNKKIKWIEQNMLAQNNFEELFSNYSDEVKTLEHCVYMAHDLEYDFPKNLVGKYFDKNDIPATENEYKTISKWKRGILTKEEMHDLTKDSNFKRFIDVRSTGKRLNVDINELANKVFFLYEHI